MRLLVTVLLLAQAVWGQGAGNIRRAVEKALPVLQRSAASFVAQRACVSCHHNVLPILMLHMAQDRGWPVDAAVLQAVEDKTFRSLRGAAALDDAIQAVTLNDPTPNDSFLLMAGHAAGLPQDLTTEVLARRLVRWQRDGHWITSDFRPPHSSSIFTATATAVRAIQLYMPEELRAEQEASLREARAWLAATRPLSTEDAAFRLLGLRWAGADEAEVAAARRDLLAMQAGGGGWPQTSNYSADAYSTGEALYALHETGTAAGGRAWLRGVRFLISTQAADGTWRVRTRMLSPAEVSPKYFTTGFPYQKDEYLSYAGSCWAVMALLAAIPEAEHAPAATVAQEPRAPAWVRTALFGTPEQLLALLDGGLDVNSKTARGTSLLMMAAPNAGKVRLLISRRADVNARSDSGADALTIACAYRGTAASVQALLDAGAAAKSPDGKRVRSSPLVFASMTGDLDNVKLLLARGADASASAGNNTPISAAVTFGYPDVTRALIAAGASTSMQESTGINLLHWSVIADRPAMIPVLVQAGVPINVVDDFGFTPLMYAATIDFGDTELVQALLKNGASRIIPNGEGRTPLQQAHRLRLAHLEAALRE
ncbi:MAG TPA: ankyrin repeat domain-containing protein [Bryobacteraceae bacterium]|nr:ankyrin repeat domain-containing protein [Bryobacteraceae bacterium]